MRIGAVPLRHTFSLLLLLAALAPAAGAQTLVPVTGEPVPYRVSVPEGWERETNDGVLMVTSRAEEMIITVTALDLAAVQGPQPSMTEAEQRRALTNRVMSNDSFHLNMLQRNVERMSPHPVSDVRKEIGTIGGEKAGCISALVRAASGDGWMRFCSTVHDGILYQLSFQGTGAIRPEQELLLARIRDSFEVADPPGPAGSPR